MPQEFGSLPPPENKSNNTIWELTVFTVCACLFVVVLGLTIDYVLNDRSADQLTLIAVSCFSFLSGLLMKRDTN